MQNDGAPTQNDAPESHAPKPDGAHSFVCCSALFCLRAVIRCAMKLLPCKILGDARKSRQHAVFERCPERCPNDARPDGSRPARSTWPKPLAVQRQLSWLSSATLHVSIGSTCRAPGLLVTTITKSFRYRK